MADFYTTGTVSVLAGGTTVSGAGVLWNEVVAGDRLELAGRTVTIGAKPESPFTTLTLAAPWTGVDQEAQSYTIRYDAPSRFTAGYLASKVRALVERTSIIESAAPVYSVRDVTNTPPGSPVEGDTYALRAMPTGAWAGNAGKLAQWTGSAWAYTTPEAGWQAYAVGDRLYVYDGGWQQPPAGGPIVVLATGQSNIWYRRDYSWEPEPNLFLWNWDSDQTNSDTLVGNAFVPMPNDKISFPRSYANALARDNPARKVLLISIGWNGATIDHWMPGATTPDMYSCVRANVTAALAAAGVSEIDQLVWWQGESDTFVNTTTMVENREAVIAGYREEEWYPYSTPIIVAGYAPYTSVINTRLYDDQQKLFCGREPAIRTFVSWEGLPTSWWEASESLIHGTASGYWNMGIQAYSAWQSGANSGRGATNSQEIVKRRSEARTADASTSVRDAELYFRTRAGKSYRIQMDLQGIALGAPGMKWNFSITSGHAIVQSEVVYGLLGAAPTRTTALTGSIASAGAFRIQADILILNSVVGDIKMLWGQNTSGAAATILQQGSVMKVIEIDYQG